MAQLKEGSTSGGYRIRTTKEIPVIFRVNGSLLQYSQDGGLTWVTIQ